MRLLCLCLFALFIVPAPLGAQADKPVVRVTAVLDGPSPVFDQAIDNLSREIKGQLSDRYTVELVDPAVPGDWTAEGVARQLDAAYSDPKIAAVFGFGHLTVVAVAKRKDLPKPTILPYVLESKSQGLPKRGDVSGRKNLSYITEDFDVSDEVDMLREVAGSQRIVVLTERSQEAVLSTVIQENALEVAVADPTVEALMAAIPSTADGLVIAPMRRLSLDDRKRLMALITRRRLPNIAVDPSWLEQGAMMSIRSPSSYERRAQRAALNLDLILEGRPSAQIHVDFEERQELQLNMEATRAIGVRPSYDILIEATLMYEEEALEQNRIEMGSAMMEAVDRNLDLQVAEKVVEAGEEQVKIDRGALFIQADAQTGVTIRDPNRVFPGVSAQYQGSTFVRARQSIYSALAWTRFKTRKYRQEGRQYGYFVNVLDVMLETGAAYVATLRAKADERIQRENIQLTREYLELSRLRLEVGVANASELYRWQAQLAENQRAVVNARALVAQSKIELNRALNRHPAQAIAPIDLPLDERGRVLPPEDAISKFMADPWSFQLLSAFMVEEGLRNSPEARQIEWRRTAAQWLKESRTREIWLPEFYIEGGAQHDYWVDGAGSESSGVPPAIQDFLPSINKGTWDVGAFAAIPLSRGGSGVAEIRQARVLRERLDAEFERVELFIDAGVRVELYNASAALASVTLTRRAADAARDNLELVVDLYRRGKVDIIRLVDAQTQSLTADLAAANAAYDYVLALLFVNREISHFRNLDDEEARQDFERRLNEFVLRADAAQSKAPPPP
ncbi:MAG: TolC family protein [Polyangiales bacterium]